MEKCQSSPNSMSLIQAWSLPQGLPISLYLKTLRFKREASLVKSSLKYRNSSRRDNPYIKDYRQIIEIPDEELATGRLVISASARPKGEHEHCYNSPVCLEEVSVLSNNRRHNLMITKRDGRFEIISEQNQSAMPLHFTLLFPSGTKGWHPGLKQSLTATNVSLLVTLHSSILPAGRRGQ